jgi:sugar phosphate isomerase/epimerase
MADLFHMNIEEDDLGATIRAAGSYLAHVHLADSQRLQPGTGHTDFAAALVALREIGFTGSMALECGLRGEPRAALAETARYLRRLM